MFNKKSFLTYIIIIMFSFFGKSEAKYEKLFFNLNIKNTDGEIINFSDYKDN